jgi:transglutaminase-like putative cysteine protease
MNLPQPSRRALALMRCLLLVSSAVALLHLPGEALRIGWLLAFLLPGMALGLLRNRLRHGWQRAIAAVALQTSACWLALATIGPMTRPAALACTILPPLGYALGRNQETDHALALFLSFCVLLIGVILIGPNAQLVAAYCVCACLVLRTSSHLAATATALPPASLPQRHGFAGLGSIVLACLLATLLLERALAVLPTLSSNGSDRAAAPTTVRRVGLDDSFELDGSGGVLSDLAGEQLVRVTAPNGRVPADLYLRSGFFVVPGLDRWQLGPLDLVDARGDGEQRLRSPLPQAEHRELAIERYAGARNFVFAPPGTFAIDGIDQLRFDRRREWVRQAAGAANAPYRVRFQELPPPPSDLPVDPRGRVFGLLTLPEGMRRDPFEALLAEWNVDQAPLPAMTAIASGLAARCRYDRIEPQGTSGHAIENFLFTDGDRRGYCMHFASAAAILLRLRGIPCRIGVGLYGGGLDPREDGARIYGSQHAHAWVEVPFVGRGYMVFDPTPPAERGQATPTRLDPTESEDPAAAAAQSESSSPSLLEWLQQPLPALATCAALLLLVVWLQGAQGASNRGAEALPKGARSLLGRLLHALAAAGHRRQRGQTLEQLLHSLAPAARGDVADAFLAYQEVRFGACPLDPARQQRLERGLATAQALPRPQSKGERAAGQA